MHLRHLSLRDFRSYAEVELAPRPGVTAFVGPNGQGKTNLVEAVGYLATLGSHRVAQDAPLVRLGAERAVVRGQVVRDDRSLLVEVEITPGGPTGRGSTARRSRGRARCSASCAACCSRPRTWRWSRATRPSAAASSTTCWCCGRRATPASAPTTTGCCASATRCSSRPARRGAGGPHRATSRTLDVWDAHLATAGAELLAGRLELVDSLRPLVGKPPTRRSPSRTGPP